MRWCLLVHQLPPRPPYLRARIAQRLARVGAIPLKNSVYVLPFRPDALEDFQWIGAEAEGGGGDAFVFEARFTDGRESEALVSRFRAARHAEYRVLASDLRRLEGGGERAPREAALNALGKLRRKLEEIARIDFFDAPGRKEVVAAMGRLEKKLTRTRERQGKGDLPQAGLRGRVWVTRRGIKIDRMATAWLVRRFVDPHARFRFVDPSAHERRPGEMLFDMAGGDLTHEGDRCTFETLVARAAIRDPAVARIAEIVHDIDIKDGKHGRPETSGIRTVVEGVIAGHAGDDERLARGAALLDDLYASFRAGKAASGT